MTIEIRRILCAIELSCCSNRTLHEAAAFANRSGAALSVLHVHRTARPPAAAGARIVREALVPLSLGAGDRMQLAWALRDLVIQETGIPEPDTVIEEASDICEAILARAAAVRADLIVIGTHGRLGLDHLELGSVAKEVLRRAASAVLTVPSTSTRDVPVSPGRILCAFDFSAASWQALHYARAMAADQAAQLTLLHVIELPPDTPGTLQADRSAQRAVRFEQARSRMMSARDEVRGTCDWTELLLVGGAGPEIVRIATEQESDLVVMGGCGRDAAEVARSGSVTHDVVRHAPCPVLSVSADRP